MLNTVVRAIKQGFFAFNPALFMLPAICFALLFFSGCAPVPAGRFLLTSSLFRGAWSGGSGGCFWCWQTRVPHPSIVSFYDGSLPRWAAARWLVVLARLGDDLLQSFCCLWPGDILLLADSLRSFLFFKCVMFAGSLWWFCGGWCLHYPCADP